MVKIRTIRQYFRYSMQYSYIFDILVIAGRYISGCISRVFAPLGFPLLVRQQNQHNVYTHPQNTSDSMHV